MTKKERPICTTCGVQVTIRHFLAECRIYRNIRINSNLLGSLADILHNHSQSISNIIDSLKLSNLKPRFKFLKLCNYVIIIIINTQWPNGRSLSNNKKKDAFNFLYVIVILIRIFCPKGTTAPASVFGLL